MKVSNERLEEICLAMVTDSSYDYAQVFDSIKSGEIYNMAKELIELREKLKQVPEKAVIKFPPDLEEHKSGLFGHRPTLTLKTPEWAEGYNEAIMDVKLINE